MKFYTETSKQVEQNDKTNKKTPHTKQGDIIKQCYHIFRNAWSMPQKDTVEGLLAVKQLATGGSNDLPKAKCSLTECISQSVTLTLQLTLCAADTQCN